MCFQSDVFNVGQFIKVTAYLLYEYHIRKPYFRRKDNENKIKTIYILKLVIDGIKKRRAYL